MFKRILLFIATNILVMATLSIFINLLGIKPYLSANGIDYTSLMVFCAIWGMGGSFISLLLSKFMAKQLMGVQVIDPKTATGNERALLNIVYTLASRAGLPKNPEVGIYNSPEINAFATGPSKSNALVAVSAGLLQAMDQKEVEGVLAHEITHVANGDMVTMMLIQGVVNAFAMFLSRIIAYAISMAMSRDNEEGGGISYLAYAGLTIVFDILFTLLGSILVAAFSRWREYRADAGGARLAGRDSMIKALERLKLGLGEEDNRSPALAALKISQKRGLMDLFASHPSLDKRIERLQSGAY